MPKESAPTQQFIEIEEIKEGAVILKSGGLRRVLMVSGVNFDLKSEEEQKIILAAYQNFLNDLDFSAQIVIHSRKLNIENYLDMLRERYEQENNELLRNQIIEYIEFVRVFVESNAVMSKTFFVVVPFDAFIMPKSGKGFLSALGLKSKTDKAKEAELAKQTFEQKLIQLEQRTEQVID